MNDGDAYNQRGVLFVLLFRSQFSASQKLRVKVGYIQKCLSSAKCCIIMIKVTRVIFVNGRLFCSQNFGEALFPFGRKGFCLQRSHVLT